MHKPSRNGLSALDVIVTIVILLVLAALLLPAVQQSNGGASLRSRCKNNLKQFALSMHNYHDVYKTLPPGWIVSADEEKSSGFGWNYSILQFFDQAPLFNKFDSRQRLGDKSSPNPELAGKILSVCRCPSDKGADQAESLWIPTIATTNYVANFGVGIPTTYSSLNQSSSQPVDPQFLQGLFGPNSRVRFRDIKDGTANVVLIGERRLPEVGTDWPAHQFEGQFNSYWAGLPDVRRVNPLTIVATATGGNVERNGEGDPLNLTGNLNATKITGWKMNLP
ncbi:MAG: DUF1559 domain-containing protein [Rhodopirellula sp.]|nr:DUF1559 domain-containing protein [Rhodopirellula sp.]